VKLFNQFGSNDFYGKGGGFPSRWVYAEDKLRLINGQVALRHLVNTIFDAREWIGKDLKPEGAAEHINKFLKFDGYEVVRDGEHFKVRETGAVAVQFDTPFPEFWHARTGRTTSKPLNGKRAQFLSWTTGGCSTGEDTLIFPTPTENS